MTASEPAALPSSLASAGALTPDAPRGLVYVLKLWLGLSLPVSRRAYLLSGVSLMGFKYALDALSMYAFTGRFFSPLPYLSPFFSVREQVCAARPSGCRGS